MLIYKLLATVYNRVDLIYIRRNYPMKKKLLSLLLASMLIIAALSGITANAGEPQRNISVYSGTPDWDFWFDILGDGPMEVTVTTADQLMAFAEITSDKNFKNWTIKLGADMVINTGDASDWATTAPAYTWKCSTAWGNRFAGNFDGQGHVISGLYSNYGQECGLFGTITGGNTIQNVSIINSYFRYQSSTRDDACLMGGIVGFIDGWEANGKYDGLTTTIQNVYVNATLYTDCAIPAPNGTSKVGVGGIVGIVGNTTSQNLTIENAVFEGDLTSSYRNLGGILGYASFFQTGDVTLKNCSVNANIKSRVSEEESEPYAGGLVGISNGTKLTVENCIVKGTMEVVNPSRTAALVGFVYTNTSKVITIKKVLLAVTPIPTGDENDVIFRALLCGCNAGTSGTLVLSFSEDDIQYDSSLYTYPTDMKHIHRISDEGMVTNTEFEATGVATENLLGQAVFEGWTAIDGEYPIPAGVTVPEINVADYQNAVAPERPISEDPAGEEPSTGKTTTEKDTTAKPETTAKSSKSDTPSDTDDTTEDSSEKKGGCRSTVGVAGLAVLALVAVAGVATFKKEENQ